LISTEPSLDSSSGPTVSLPVRVITPHSGLDAFRDAIVSLRKDFLQAKELAWRFFLRDTRAEHRQSVLGYFWLVFPALANTLTWVFLNHQQVIHIDTGSIPYPIFVLSGTILWAAFNSSLMAMLGIVGAARGVLSKVNFPRESLVYSAILKSSIDSGLAALLLIPALFFFGIQWTPSTLLFPAALAGSLLLGSAIGLAVLPIAALYSDVGRVFQFVLRFGFFLTPVIFQLPQDGIARTLMLVNPVTPVIVTGRAWLTGFGESLPIAFWAVAVGSISLFLAALLFYKVALPYVIERVSG
jgi:lipopolysaccharide transport system permease protein